MRSTEFIDIEITELTTDWECENFKTSPGWTLFSDADLFYDLYKIGFIKVYLLKIKKQSFYVFGKAARGALGVKIFDLSHYPLHDQLDRFKINKNLYLNILNSFNKYFDLITEIPPPPFLNQINKNLKKSYMSIDVKLCATLSNDFGVNQLHPKIKQSVRYVDASPLIQQIKFFDMDHVEINDILLIEASKSKRLNINPIDKSYLEAIKKNKNYYFSIIKFNSDPVAYNVFQIQNQVATYHLNGSVRSDLYRDINKYLMYTSLKKISEMGVRKVYFGDWVYESTSSLDLYKARLGNEISFAIRNDYPLTFHGHFYCIYKKLKFIFIQWLNIIR